MGNGSSALANECGHGGAEATSLRRAIPADRAEFRGRMLDEAGDCRNPHVCLRVQSCRHYRRVPAAARELWHGPGPVGSIGTPRPGQPDRRLKRRHELLLRLLQNPAFGAFHTISEGFPLFYSGVWILRKVSSSRFVRFTGRIRPPRLRFGNH